LSWTNSLLLSRKCHQGFILLMVLHLEQFRYIVFSFQSIISICQLSIVSLYSASWLLPVSAGTPEFRNCLRNTPLVIIVQETDNSPALTRNHYLILYSTCRILRIDSAEKRFLIACFSSGIQSNMHVIIMIISDLPFFTT